MMETQTMFVEEIDFSELNFLEIVGRGAFGVVSRAKYRGLIVAVKLIETESERKAFITELKQLSRVNHPNIVKLYGASTVQPVCLVMEYAEGGSLYNVLHGTGTPITYTAAHAMSWALQCARGVEYLHGMKPKPLVHRDLKPPNLLLILGGTVLKICDFGTACDAHTHMTNNKGSAAWMAPEVFEGNNYSEKCDVFSWGIILWEIITRRKPFDEIGGPAFRIMWAVHSGTRPPPIKNCPKPIEVLYTRCWCSNPVERPSMSEVTRIMSHLFQFFNGAEEPLYNPSADDASSHYTSGGSGSSTYDNAQLTSQQIGPLYNSQVANISMSISGRDTPSNTIHDTIRQPFVNSPVFGRAFPNSAIQSAVPGDSKDTRINSSAPASLHTSQENLTENRGGGRGGVAGANGRGPRYSGPIVDEGLGKRFSTDLSTLREMEASRGGVGHMEVESARRHRRTGSHGTPFVPEQPVASTVVQSGHRRTGSFGNTVDNAFVLNSISGQMPQFDNYVLNHTTTAPGNLEGSGTDSQGVAALRSTSWTGPGERMLPNNGFTDISDPGMMSNLMYFDLQQQLQPIPPCPTNPESVAIYQNHCKLAEEYLKMQAEITVLDQRKKELTEELEQEDKTVRNAAKLKQDYGNLLNENEHLKLLQSNLLKQLEQIENNRAPNQLG